MEYLVCENSGGFLFVMSRADREVMISVLCDLGNGVPSRVVKVFEDEVSAQSFVDKINSVDDLLNNTLNE